MRILHVVTLFSPDGEYGGPVRVALNQAVALRELGHEVTIAAGAQGYAQLPTEQEGVPLVLFRAAKILPGVGFASLCAPEMLRWLVANAKRFDIVHLHMARDLILLPCAALVRKFKIPYVIQSHGMLAPNSNPLAPVLDTMFVRRLLHDAHTTFYLTSNERDGLAVTAKGSPSLSNLNNGVPLYESALPPDGPPEVLFLARLHERKRPLDFIRAAKLLHARGNDALFTLVGPDEGEGQAVQTAISGMPFLRWEGSLPSGHGPTRMRTSTAYVLPAVDEPFPMSVLEAMAVGLPVVITDQCGLADFVHRTHSGLVITPGEEHVASAIATLLGDIDEARQMGQRGREAVRREMNVSAVASQLLQAYQGAVGDSLR